MLFDSATAKRGLTVTMDGRDPVSDASFFTEALEMTLRAEGSWFNLQEKMMRLEHRALVSEDAALLQEGEQGFWQRVKDWFVRLWDGIKNIWKRFVLWLQRMWMNDKDFVKKYKGELEKADVNGMKYKGFVYSISADCPVVTPEVDFLKDVWFDPTSGSFGNVEGGANGADAMTKLNVEKNLKRYDDDSAYDDLRARILGVTGKVSETDWSEALFKRFRDNETSEDEIEVTSTLISTMMNSLDSNDSDRKKCEKTKQSLDTFYKGMVDYFGNMTSVKDNEVNVRQFHVNTADGKFTYDKNEFISGASVKDENNRKAGEAFQAYSNYKANQAKRVASLFNTAFGAKLDAMKERRQSYRDVLQRALVYRKKKGEV